MIDFSVCIETAFAENERSLPDRVRAAADSGFKAVEIWEWQGKPIADLGRALRETKTELHTLCVESWRDKCQLGDPQSHGEFVERVSRAADIALELGTPKLVVLAGDMSPNWDVPTQLSAAADALAKASDKIAGLPIELLVEVVNRQFEGPNALLQDTATTVQLLRRLDRPNVRFLYDRYHAILNGEALGWAIDDAMPLIGHIQIADIPGRHELGTGQVNWAEEFAYLLRQGYDGHLGLELIPLDNSSTIYPSARARLDTAKTMVS